MTLIIVESPTKARTLSRFLGSGFEIEASMGHVRDLPEKKFGVDLEHDFAPQYEISPKKKETVAKLKAKAKEADRVILATDPDREGEAIAWHIASLLADKSQIPNPNLQRITFHEITESAIKDALANPREIDMNLVDAQQARRILDRVVGYKLSPLLWRKVRRGLSAGRVQSVAVRLIAEREREIQVFKPVEYWEIVAQLKKGSEFEAKLAKTEVHNQEEAEAIVAELQKAQYQVADVQTKEVKRSPYPPFTTSTLQQAASNLFGWGAKRTMQVAQNLYERGLITYHRTDSTNLAIEAVSAVRDFINLNYGPAYLPEAPKLYKTKSKVAQEAHEAIRPTKVGSDAREVETLDRDQKKLYDLVWKRFVACQMTESKTQQTGADIAASPRHSGERSDSRISNENARDAGPGQHDEKTYLLRATGSRLLFDGWTRLYQKLEAEEEKSQVLPELTVGAILELLHLLPSQHFTEPPPRYTEASLIKALEEYGIGRPSTYAPILSTIQERFYVEKVDKKLIPTALGFAANDFLVANFPVVLDYGFTANMENDLDAVANGDKQWVPVIREFYTPFAQKLTQALESSERVKVEVETTDEICPNDGSPLVVRVGKFGRFLACSKFPECKFTKPFIQKLNMPCPKCGGDVIIKKTRTKKTFYGCSNYPKCDFASWTKPKVVNL
jgi:DNA topoisomerase I